MQAPTWLVMQEHGIGEAGSGQPTWIVSARIRWEHPGVWRWLWAGLPGPVWYKPLLLGYWLTRQSIRRVLGCR